MEQYIPALIGLGGAVIGSSAAVITMLIQAKIHDKREMLKLAKELAVIDHDTIFKAASSATIVPPIHHFLHFHMGMLKLIEGGKATPEAITALRKAGEPLLDDANT